MTVVIRIYESHNCLLNFHIYLSQTKYSIFCIKDFDKTKSWNYSINISLNIIFFSFLKTQLFLIKRGVWKPFKRS